MNTWSLILLVKSAVGSYLYIPYQPPRARRVVWWVCNTLRSGRLRRLAHLSEELLLVNHDPADLVSIANSCKPMSETGFLNTPTFLPPKKSSLNNEREEFIIQKPTPENSQPDGRMWSIEKSRLGGPDRSALCCQAIISFLRFRN